jgi:enoyl-CoA hydratase/carnithine racemase
MGQGLDSKSHRPAGPAECLRRYEVDGVLVLAFTAPILSLEMLLWLDGTLIDLEHDHRPLVLASEHPSIFLAGAHLGEISRLDAHTSCGYARFGRQVLARLALHPAPVVAAVAGSCSGGGFDLVLSCDLVVAGRTARFSHPGVRRGLVTGWGGTVLVPAALGRSPAQRVLLEGSPVQPAEVAVTCDHLDAEPLLPAIAEARRLASLHPSRLHTWRCLRNQPFVDRFRIVVVHNKGREEPVMSAIRRT